MSKFGERRAQRASEKAAAKAEADARHQARMLAEAQASYERRRSSDRLVAENLCQYAGHVIVVTNPGDDERRRDELHRPIAEAIQRVLPTVVHFGFSQHVRSTPNSGVGMFHGSNMVVEEMSKLYGRDLVKEDVLRMGLGGYAIGVSVLEEEVSNTFFDHDPETTAHVAFTSALGIEALNLDYFKARYGSTFNLAGVTEAGDLRWDKIFAPPYSEAGPHHYDEYLFS